MENLCGRRENKNMECLFILEDGIVFEGKVFGVDVNVFGEIVFIISMIGY